MELLPPEILSEVCRHLYLRDIVNMVHVSNSIHSKVFEWRLDEWREILKMNNQILRMCVDDVWTNEIIISMRFGNYLGEWCSHSHDPMIKIISSYGSPRLIKSEPTLIHYLIKYNTCDYKFDEEICKRFCELEKIYRFQDFSSFIYQSQLLTPIMELVYKHKLHKLFIDVCQYKDIDYKKLTLHTDFTKLFIQTRKPPRLSPILDCATDNNNIELVEYLVGLGFKYSGTQLYRDGKFFSKICSDFRPGKIVDQMITRLKYVERCTLREDFLTGKCTIQEYTTFDKLSHKSIYFDLFESLYRRYESLSQLVDSKMNILCSDTEWKCRYTSNCLHCTPDL